MSISAILRALGWIPVVWLLAVHLLVERGRLPRDGLGFRIAGGAAAGLIIIAGVMFAMWPVAALGLLWLRTEVFAHQHSLERDAARHERFRREGPQPWSVRRRPGQQDQGQQDWGQHEWGQHGQGQHGQGQHGQGQHGQGLGQLNLPAWLPTDQGSHRIEQTPRRRPLFGPRAVNALFKIEVMIVVIVALAAFGIWAQHNKADFDRKANTNLCRLRGGC